MNKAFKLDKTNIEDIVNLTSLQEGILFHYLKDVSKNSYFVQLSLEIQGSVKFDYFQKAWNKVVENNEMLRTVFRWEKLNKPVQVILKENNVDIRYYDLLIEENKLESEYQKIKLKDYNESFDLREVPFRLTLCKFKTDKYILLISNHHIIYDGWSNGIILKEFLNYYNELVTGSLLKVNKKTSFKNYLKLNREPSTEDESFWKDYLNGFEPKNVFSFKNTGSLSDNSNNQSHRFSISEDKFSKLKQLCKSQKLSIADILYGAWGILLSKYSGETDMLFGTIVSGRNIKFEGIERMVGLFINTIPIRIRITSDKTLISILKENAKQTLERGRFENVPLLNILDYSGYKENELIESIFVVENYPLDKENLQQQEELAFKSFSIQETTNYKLTVSALISDEIEISFNYISAYFERELIENIEKHYVRIIDKIIDDNKSAIQSLDLLSDIEKHQLLYEFNNTKRDYPKDKTIHQLFEEQVALAPDRIALIMGDRRISYFDLNKMSNQVALNLLEFGVCSESIVGLLVDRSVEMMIGILGILKAGGAYLPIDPEAPEKRINYILDDSNAKVLLLQKNKKEGKNYILPVMVINSDLSIKEEDLILEDNTNAHNLSYVIYTSGSTGEPKGVMIEHHSVINRLKWMQDSYPIGSKDVLIQKTPYTFDVSVWELFWWSLEGSTLFLLEKGGEKDPSQIVKGISENNVSIIHFVPSMLDVFLEYLKDYYQHSSLESLRYIFASGEELKNSHVEKFYEVFGKESKCLLVNLYGPTEATVDVTYFNCNSKDQYNSIPIGKPIANTQVCILNTTNRQLQAIGIIGELCLSGVGLSRGYLGMEDLTSEKFIDHPFKEGERLYRTGDLARWLPDGNIEFLGRIDHQVKIRGFRIELGEIENVILQYKNIKECVVLVREDQGDKYLCAYMVSGKEQNTEELRTYLSGLLPDYMLPSYFLYLEEMPLTGNGKLNRKSLPAPEIKAGSAYIAPKNIIETKLVKIWSEVLNVASKEISTNVSFFEFGGHSLKATVLVSRIHNELDVQLELREVFKFPTIQTQAELINSSETTSYFSIPKAKTEEYYPLSSSQRRLYLLQQIDLGSMAYNMPGLISVPKDYNKHQIEEVFYKLIARHENFRTSFEVENELPVQRIHSEVSFSIKNYQITNTELSNVRENFVHAFDLSLAPLLRVVYLEISDGDDMLLVDMHHIISDGKSHSILEEDFSQLLLGKELAPLHLQYKDYSQWQNSKEQQERIN
ncbi:MAG: amino acid adenylation domain-containing protein, partial [Bacteroidales bacterium]|nr:amino acid adenylation domain-containing protein [Bacteroidales bacterium]